MKTYKGIIFDVDGVIINTENLHCLAYQHVLRKHGYKLTLEKYKEHFSGKSIKGGILSLLAEIDISGETNRDKFIQLVTKQKINETVDLFKRELTFFDDTIQFIDRIQQGDVELKNIGIIDQNPVLAITTGLEQVLLDEVLKRYDLKNIITVIVTPEQYTHSKPNPECYKITLNKMDLNPDVVIGAEDSPAGIDALNATNIFSIGITNTHHATELQKSRLVTEAMSELLK